MVDRQETKSDAIDDTGTEDQQVAIQRIPVDDLTPGMYVVALDCAWPEYARLTDNRIKSPEDVIRLKSYGVRSVTIDPTLGKPTGRPGHEMAAPLPLPEHPSAAPPESRGGSNARVQKLAGLEEELARAHTARSEAMTIVQSIFEGVKTGSPIDSVAVKQTVQSLMSNILSDYDPFLCVLHMRQYDTSLFAHAVNICAFALIVGKSQGFDKSRLECLGVGALLHDVGKLRLPRNLLRKQGPYTLQERQLVRQHPLLGVAVLTEARGISEESRRIVLEHHERVDGSGYPGGLTGLQISPLSEIVGIIDIYDAMLSGREGRPLLPPAQAIKELYKQGLQGHCDRGWVERTIRCLGIYPVGSLIELNTGERGIVLAVNPADALRPTVKLVWDPSGWIYTIPTLVDLAARGEHERTIVRALDPVKEHLNIAPYLEGKP